MTDDNCPDPVFDEMYDCCYQALANAAFSTGSLKNNNSYAVGYLDAWADAMSHAGWAVEGKPATGRTAFALLRNRRLRRRAKRLLVEQRARTRALSERAEQAQEEAS